MSWVGHGHPLYSVQARAFPANPMDKSSRSSLATQVSFHPLPACHVPTLLFSPLTTTYHGLTGRDLRWLVHAYVQASAPRWRAGCQAQMLLVGCRARSPSFVRAPWPFLGRKRPFWSDPTPFLSPIAFSPVIGPLTPPSSHWALYALSSEMEILFHSL